MPWTEDEKLQFLQALNRHGADNIFAIMDELPFKSILEVKRLINYYRTLAQTKLQTERSELQMNVSPIDKWIKIMYDVKGKSVTFDHVSRALKYIALYEKRTKNDINLKNCYMVLSALAKGIPPKELDPLSLYYLQTCARDLALKISKEDTTKEKEFLENWTMEKLKMCRSYRKKVVGLKFL